MRKLNKWQTFLYKVGAIMLLAGVATARMQSYVTIALFVLGALLFCCMQLLQRYEGTDITILRLRRQQIFSCMLIILSACAYTMQALEVGPSWTHRNNWLILLTVACIFQVYSIFRLSHELDKAQKGNVKKK